jgi:hypothetical protein
VITLLLCYLLGLIFGPEDGGIIFLRNVSVGLHGVTEDLKSSIFSFTFITKKYTRFELKKIISRDTGSCPGRS